MHLRPLAIGILGPDSGVEAPRSHDERIRMSVAANGLGYGLLDIFEVGTALGPDEPIYASIELVADRHDAQALLVLGNVDRSRVDEIADRVRLRVVALP